MSDSCPERPIPAPTDDLVVSRRGFLKGAGGLAIGSGALQAQAGQTAGVQAPGGQVQSGEPVSLSGNQPLVLTINGERRRTLVEPRTTLLSALRHRCEPALTGAKEVCGRGNCGACTVLLDGEPVYACLTLALEAEGRQVISVEGLGSVDQMSVVQEAFCARDAAMCGFCTPGFVVAATALLRARPLASRAEIVEGLCGNLCRCGTYPHVFDAVEAARDAQRAGSSQGGVR
jgi:xanthine dehydrogenase YagT iron-sulfur-binding subunit